ncbi:hypothetical protein HANVADRAFT_51634 [Hanseniaspora valbyensis NRRL Y-1626]|uniref:EB1 C-terminal domain-containing protein n=1 Tax=Hanseniaspora valbyensis NRRL Y-1626 TaxID=766949 RepID=A0A1B7THV6_9ASCO|nr:hypothetical protein HANVADRAFT_51634 [Hanseniaspora valbyensis NRRL Y-1626]
MNVAFSRQQLINWINECLDLNLSKIEDLGVGSIYLQLMDFINVTIHQNKSFPMHQVYWTMDLLFEDQIFYEDGNKKLRIIKNPQLAGREQKMSNYKLLQKWFQELKIKKIIPIDKLILCKFQNNLEFVQWVFKYIMQTIKIRGFQDINEFLIYVKNENLYDPVSRRFAGASHSSSTSSPSSETNSRRSSILPKRSNGSINGSTTTNLSSSKKTLYPETVNTSGTTRRANSSNNRILSTTSSKISNTTAGSRNVSTNTAQRTPSNNTTSHNNNFDIQETKQIKKTISKYENVIQSINSERQFYFDKLRSLELLILTIQENNNIETNPELQQLVTHVLKILYSNEQDVNENDVVDVEMGDADEEVKKTSLDLVHEPEKPLLSIDDSEMF